MARDMAAHVSGDDARISIETTAGGEADDEANSFTAVKIRVGWGSVR